ncbi:hypothetical protein JCM33374_g2387 [Metschnikowia sp. JCM 33374]|nr:hypothetical protein JCM33374_g2387 [Metschnikowia sp. JCM 33374]
MNNSQTIIYDDEFLQDWFPELPSQIIEDVCGYISSDIIKETLLQVPKLRNVIIDHYYSKDLHLILSPTKRPHFCSPDTQRKEMIDIVSYGDIEDFLEENPDINPRVIKVITSGDFKSMEDLLRSYHARIEKAPRLEIYVEKYELTSEDVQLIFSFPNLFKFSTSHIKLNSCFQELALSLPKSQNLQELVFLGHEITDWSTVKFPPKLTHLDMSWYENTAVSTVDLPASLENIYWNQTGWNTGVFEQVSYPPSIKTLMITYNSLTSFNVSQLPPTLETIDLSNNSIKTFEIEGASPCWPRSLKSILLNSNPFIDDSSLKQLSAIAWPPFLENLRLDGTSFTSLEHLCNLPHSLKYLDLSQTPIQSFKVKNNCDEYPFFKFPESLETLNMYMCSDVSYGEVSESEWIPLDQRIKFPPNLESLDLSECQANKLSYFIFPPSLKTLSLTGNRLVDLTTYNLNLGTEEIVSWKHLSNLRDLELYYNSITNLEGWVPPKSLRRVDLRRNLIKCLTASNTPLFREEYHDFTNNIQTLNFDQNQIETIEETLVLPSNLRTLNLATNNLTQFVFTHAFASHNTLVRLDLGFNYIERVSVAPHDEKFTCHLQQFNLSRNAPKQFHMTPAEFYSVFEQIGLTVTKRKNNIKSEHVFK